MEEAFQLDKDKIYQTKALIKRVGKAIAVDLSDANVPHSQEIKDPHMTLIFMKQGVTNEDLKTVENQVQEYFKDKPEKLIKFKIPEMWGKQSALIEGDLKDFHVFIRDKCKQLCADDARKPHVEIRKSRRN